MSAFEWLWKTRPTEAATPTLTSELEKLNTRIRQAREELADIEARIVIERESLVTVTNLAVAALGEDPGMQLAVRFAELRQKCESLREQLDPESQKHWDGMRKQRDEARGLRYAEHNLRVELEDRLSAIVYGLDSAYNFLRESGVPGDLTGMQLIEALLRDNAQYNREPRAKQVHP